MTPVDLDRLATAEKVIAGAGIVLVVDLAFLPWHSIDLGIATWARSATQSPGRVWGVLALLLTVAVVAVTLLRALRPEATLPRLPVGWEAVTLAAAATTTALLLVKLALDTGHLGLGAWLGIALAGTMTAGALLATRDGADRPDVAE